jgi:hypothetical protein
VQAVRQQDQIRDRCLRVGVNGMTMMPREKRLDGISLALRKAGTSYALGVSAVMWRIGSVPSRKRM